MSLQVWLPLTKDLRNQGLSSVTVTGGTIDNSGKLGKCYLVTKTSPITITQSIPATSEWTVNFWAKLPSSMNNATVWEVMFNFPTINADTGANGTSNINWASYHNVKIWDDTNHQWFWAAPGTHFNYDTWHMWTIAHTANGSGVTGKIYIDGNLIGTYNNTTHQMKIRPGSITIGGGISTGGFYVNDFRIYDHCLSPMEVKELAKGLVLHYPLNRQGLGQDNILLNTGFQSRYTQSTGWDTTKNGTQLASSWGGYNSGVGNQATVYHAHLKEFNGEWVYEYIKTANESWLGISQGGLQSKLTAGKTYTFSWEEYHVDGTNRVGTGLYYFKTGATSANFHLGIQQASNIVREIGKWQKYSYTFIAPSDADWSKSMSWYIYGHYNGNGTFYVRHIKLEEGSIATPWCPNSADTLATTMGLNSTTEYDCSGFCNNGTRTGTFTWTSDTPKYAVSTSAQGSSGAKIIGPGMSAEVKSAAIWVKCAKTVNSVFFADKNSTLECGLLNSLIYANTTNSAGFTTTHWKDNQWNHVVVVNDNGTRRVYVNGESETANGANNYYMHTTDAVYLWTRSDNNSYPFNGQMSDFRIYATALSADDVKSLYQNCATIDPDGTIRGQIRS